MAASPTDRMVTGSVDSGSGAGEINFLDEETRKRAIECIQKRGKITITSSPAGSQELSTAGVQWTQQVD